MSNSPQPAGRLTRHHLVPHRRLRRISAAEQSTTVNEQRTILVFEEAQRADSNDCHGFQSVEKGQQNNQSPERVTENNFAVGVYRSQPTRPPVQGKDGSLAQTSPGGHSSSSSSPPARKATAIAKREPTRSPKIREPVEPFRPIRKNANRSGQASRLTPVGPSVTILGLAWFANICVHLCFLS